MVAAEPSLDLEKGHDITIDETDLVGPNVNIAYDREGSVSEVEDTLWNGADMAVDDEGLHQLAHLIEEQMGGVASAAHDVNHFVTSALNFLVASLRGEPS